jgi:membrane protein DedA with SNARE-associated domain
LVVGLVMYFMSPWFSALTNNAKEVMANPQARFFAVEHISMMIIAIALITVGYSRAKRQEDDKRKSKTILIFYGIGLVLIFAMIPWPFLKEFGTWF